MEQLHSFCPLFSFANISYPNTTTASARRSFIHICWYTQLLMKRKHVLCDGWLPLFYRMQHEKTSEKVFHVHNFIIRNSAAGLCLTETLESRSHIDAGLLFYIQIFHRSHETGIHFIGFLSESVNLEYIVWKFSYHTNVIMKASWNWFSWRNQWLSYLVRG